MIYKVDKFISKHKLLEAGDKVLVALSGGADSVALLLALTRLGYRCCAMHCNFHLRGEESNRDQLFTEELCRKLGVELHTVHFNTKAYATEKGISIEMAARELRYTAFEEQRKNSGAVAIAVAHHQDDAVETFLLNLIRGAGINGLTGMRMRNGYVVRPLLCLTRSEVLGFLDASGQSYVTDSTNLTDEYARNKVRLHLVPLMQQINLSAATNIMQAADHLADAATIYNGVIADNSSRVVTSVEDGVDVSIASLMDTEVPKTQLFEILHPYGFNSRQVADVFRAMLGDGVGRMFYADDYVLLIDRTSIMLRHRNVNREVSFTLPHEGVMTLPDGARLEIRRFVPDASWQVPRHCDTCVLDASRFVSPLTLRHPCEGDRFRPFGLKGTKLLSDLYTDIKLDRIAKQRQWVLCHDDDIVWAVGVRASELCRLQSDEQEVVEITYHPAID